MQKLIKRAIKEQLDDNYTSKIKVDLYIEGVEEDVEYTPNAIVRYRIDMEHRSWGIKDISISIIDPIDIDYRVEGATKDETLRVDIGELLASGVATESWMAGNSYSVEGIDIYLNNDRTIKSVGLDLNYAKPYGA